MKIKALFLVFLAATVVSVSAYAQQSLSDEHIEFRPHLYGQVQAGGAYTRGETVFYKLLSPAGYLSVGYQFSPVLGLRVVGGGWQGKGNGLIPLEVYKYNFLQGNADLTLSLSSLFGGYKHDRVLDLYGFVGGGALYAFNNGAAAVSETNITRFEYLWDTNILPVGRFGFGADYRLTDCLSLTLEANLNITSDRFNSKKADNPDFQYNALVGLKYIFGGKPYRESASYLAAIAAAKEAEELARAKAEADSLARAKAAAEAEAKAQAEREAAEQRAREEEERKQEVVDNPADHNICTFFDKNKDVIRPEEDLKIIGLAEYLKAHPEYTVAMCGYADVQTGNARINRDLSARRVAAVKARLVAYGIDANRITSDFKGDTIQPFEENDLNRVVISLIK